MVTVQLLDFTTGQERIMGVISLNAGAVIMQGQIPAPIRRMLDELLADAASPTDFLTRLPQQISGTYLRARAVA